MTLQDAIEEYAAMAILGASALQRFAEKRPNQAPRADVSAILDEIVDRVERLKTLAVERTTN